MEEAGKVILLIDDDADFAKVVKIYFDRSGFELIWASSGRKALKVIRSAPPDLVILDVMLPKMNGVEVCRDLRASRGLKKLPIIVLTAYPNNKIKQEMLSLGADLYLTKPIGMDTLVEKILEHLPKGANRSPSASL